MKNKVLNWLKPNKENTDGGNSFQVRLVEGIFEPSESADVLLSLLNYKIKFHNVQLLNFEGQENKDLEKSKRRIEELKLAKKQVTELVVDARDKGHVLEIQSTITIIPKSNPKTLNTHPTT